MSTTSPTQMSYDVFVSDGLAASACRTESRWRGRARCSQARAWQPIRGGSAAGAGLDRGVFPRVGGP